MSKMKRRSMDDVLASMSGMATARPVPEPAPVETPVSEAPADKPVKHRVKRVGGTPLRFDPEYVKQLVGAGYMTPEEAASVEMIEPASAVEPVEETTAPIAETTPQKPVAVSLPNKDTRARSHVRKEEVARQTRPASVPRGYNVRPPRIEKPHQSIYADPAVFKVIRQIAAAEDVKPQDLYREALRHLLKRRGFDFDKLDRGEG